MILELIIRITIYLLKLIGKIKRKQMKQRIILDWERLWLEIFENLTLSQKNKINN